MHYQAAIQKQPNYLEATIKLGTQFLRMKRSASAAEQFNRAIEINDEIVDAYIGLAIAQHCSGEADEGSSTISLASAIQQNSTLLFSETATIRLQIALDDSMDGGQAPETILLEDVVDAHKKQLTAKPASPDVHYRFGMLMMATNDLPQALKSFETALSLNPTHYRARSKMAICLHEVGKVDQAAKLLFDSTTPDLSTIQLHYSTAILYCDRAKFAAALSSMAKQMQKDLPTAETIVSVEVVLENLGLVDRAVTTWERLTETAHSAISERYI